jgi:hypothetical protein
MRTIAVMTGAAGAGKSSIAMHLHEELGFRRVRFAEKLKAMARALGLNEDEIEGHLKEKPCSKLTFDNFPNLMQSDPFATLGADIDSDPEGFEPIEMFGGRNARYAVSAFLHVVLLCISKAGPEGATPRSLMQMIGTDWGRKMIRDDLWIDMWRRQVAALPASVSVVVDDCRFENELAECQGQGDALVFRIVRDAADGKLGEIEQKHESEAYVLPHDYLVRNNSALADAANQVRHRVWEKESII